MSRLLLPDLPLTCLPVLTMSAINELLERFDPRLDVLREIHPVSAVVLVIVFLGSILLARAFSNALDTRWRIPPSSQPSAIDRLGQKTTKSCQAASSNTYAPVKWYENRSLLISLGGLSVTLMLIGNIRDICVVRDMTDYRLCDPHLAVSFAYVKTAASVLGLMVVLMVFWKAPPVPAKNGRS